MRRPHRAAHRMIWLVLAVALPLVLFGSVIANLNGPPRSGLRSIRRLHSMASERTGLTECRFVNKVRRTMSIYVIEHHDVVRPEWIDSNGHMNLAYYVVAFDHATDKLYTALDIGDAYREATHYSCFTAETHTLYERELMLGEKLVVRTMLLDVDSKRLHYFHEMFHTESGDRAAAQELLALHIDMRIRRVAPFPQDKLTPLEDAVGRYRPAELPRGAGRKIGLPGRA